LPIDAKQKLVAQLNAALAEAYQGIANPREIMVLINEYALEHAGVGGRLTSEDPASVEATAARGSNRERGDSATGSGAPAPDRSAVPGHGAKEHSMHQSLRCV
jgi:phenylpyruvate tautomerase PptA (4-oxalocrotonate tautomerase family)